MAIRNTIVNEGYDLDLAWIEIASNNRLLVTHTDGYAPYLTKVRNVQYVQIAS
jgi:hypothetical protein